MAKHVVFRLFPIILLLVASACAAKAASPGGPATVDITADDFSFQSSVTTFQVGTPYHFSVTNRGKVPHEIMIMQPVKAGMMSMEEMDKMALAHIEQEDLQSGATASVDYTFTAPAQTGALEFACHLPGHYEAGMKLPIEVK